MIEELSTPVEISTQAIGTMLVLRVLTSEKKRLKTHNIHLYIIQQWWAHEAAVEHLYLAEPFPPGQMPSGGAIEEYPRIIQVARHTHT